MAIVQRFAHLSRLAFFLSLGAAAAFVSACSKDSENDSEGHKGSGGRTSSSQGGTSGKGTGQGGVSDQATEQGGAAANVAGSQATGWSPNTGTATTIIVPPQGGHGGLWDVICE